MKEFLKEFCNIVMPNQVNVKEKVNKLGYHKSTFYYWKNGKRTPNLRDAIQMLDERGYELKIVIKKDAFK